ncbi:hypothetical protein ACWGIV_25850 [Streptomyces sp. NPDC054844]
MPILDMDPGQSPEAPGTLKFYRQGQDPDSGVVLSTDGTISGTVAAPVELTGAATTTDVLTARVEDDPDPRFTLDANGRMEWTDGDGAADVTLFRDIAGTLKTGNFFVAAALQSDGDVSMYGTNFTLGTAGGRLRLKEGAANSTMGRAVLVAGTATVNTTSVTDGSEVFLTTQVPGGTVGAPYVSARVAGTSFTITSTSGTDTSTVGWQITEPAP